MRAASQWRIRASPGPWAGAGIDSRPLTRLRLRPIPQWVLRKSWQIERSRKRDDSGAGEREQTKRATASENFWLSSVVRQIKYVSAGAGLTHEKRRFFRRVSIVITRR